MNTRQTTLAALSASALLAAATPAHADICSALAEAQAKVASLQGAKTRSDQAKLRDWTIQLKTLRAEPAAKNCR